METHLVYVATNKINGKQYVGLTQRTLAQRWYEHTGVSPRTVWRICNNEGKSRQNFAFKYA